MGGAGETGWLRELTKRSQFGVEVVWGEVVSDGAPAGPTTGAGVGAAAALASI